MVPRRSNTSRLKQGLELRRAPAGSSIPALLGREASGVAALRLTLGDIGEGLVRSRVDEGVQPAHGRLALRDTSVVDESKDACGGRGGARSAVDANERAVPRDGEVLQSSC